MNIENKIAIIGISCRFPGAMNYGQYWNNLLSGEDSIREIPKERWDQNEYYAKDPREPQKSISKWCGILDDVTAFDHEFFGITAREAPFLDPQQRISLESTWHCIEDSGIRLDILQKANTSVYFGIMSTDYIQLLSHPECLVDAFHTLGNYEGMLANRISHCLGLTGNSQSINAACASSLVAMHEAKKSLVLGESNYSFAGGVSLNLMPWKYISFSKAGMLSRQGRCKTFDIGADGYVPGDGVGVVLLERLEDAIKNEHHIYGVIAGSAVNHTGKSRGISAPRVEAQKKVIEQAIKDAGIKAHEIAYVEAHGTGTSLGDPIEVEALTQVYQCDNVLVQSCPIGSVKTNIGHLEAAAGVASVIKVLMMFKHKLIPPLLHLEIPNPVINFKTIPFRLVTKTESLLIKSERGFLAGISSFGFGGSNSHLILESYDPKNAIQAVNKKNRKDGTEHGSATKKQIELILLSAASIKQVQEQKGLLRHHWVQIKQKEHVKEMELIQQIAGTLSTRRQMSVRSSRVIQSVSDYEDFLDQMDDIIEVKPPLFHLHVADPISDIKTLLNFKKIYESLSSFGLVVDSISGYGQANRLVGLLSGMIELTDIEHMISNPLSSASNPSPPTLPVWSGNKYQPWFLQYSIDEPYLDSLLADLKLEKDKVLLYIDKIRLLAKYQHTFKRYLLEWDRVLDNKDIQELRVTHVLGNDGSCFSMQSKAEKLQLLLMIIVESCLQRISQRWTLAPEKFFENELFYEIVDLVVDQVMNYEDVIDLILNAKSSRNLIAVRMQDNCERIDRNKPYTLLKHHTKMILSKDNDRIQGWIKDTANCENFLEESLRGRGITQILQLGGEQSFFDSMTVTCIKNSEMLEPSLLLYSELFQAGLNINNEVLYPKNSYKSISLPGYPFNRVAHWINLPEIHGVNKILKSLDQVEMDYVKSELTKTMEDKQDIDKVEAVQISVLDKIRTYLAQLLSKELELKENEIDFTVNIGEYGIDSILSSMILAEIRAVVPDIHQSLFLEHKTLEDIASYLMTHYKQFFINKLNDNIIENPEEKKAMDDVEKNNIILVCDEVLTQDKLRDQQNSNRTEAQVDQSQSIPSGMAIIGMSGIFPQAENIEEFFKNLEESEVVTTSIPPKRLELLKVSGDEKKKIQQLYGGFIDQIEQFDYEKFKFTYEEALQIDPQLRKLFEMVWKAIGDSGYRVKDFNKKETGVFVACRGHSGYVDVMRKMNKEYDIEFPALYANRISHVFNLKGPSEIVDTGCSSFIAAIDKAFQAFQRGDCKQAIIGTATLNLYLHELSKEDLLGLYSKQGMTKSFSHDADGFVRSEIIGALVVKPLSDAEREGDYIYGVIKGVGIYHGGKSPLKWNSPNINGQKVAIKKAILQSRIHPSTIDYVEAEANGTVFVDSSEIVSIQTTYGEYLNKSDNLRNKNIYIGSIKPLTGHAETSSAFPSLLKLILSIKKKTLFGVKGLEQIHNALDIKDGFCILKKDEAWLTPNSSKEINQPKRVALNCLGLGGVNAHLIMEEYQKEINNSLQKGRKFIFIFSDESSWQLKKMLQSYVYTLLQLRSSMSDNEIMHRLEYTLHSGRDEEQCRLAVVVNQLDDLISSLNSWIENREYNIKDYYFSNDDTKKDVKNIQIEACIERNDWKCLAEYWVNGAKIKWESLLGEKQVKRFPFPTTTLKKLYCWPFDIQSKPGET